MEKRLFISYCHKDDEYRKSFDTHLSLMKRNKEISSWSDRKLIPGQEWDHEISQHLENADIITFLVSSDFINSDYCYDIEVKRAIEKHEEGSAVVIPILVRACDWNETPFGKIQALPKDVNPVKLWGDEDSAWLDVVKGIRGSIKALEETKEQGAQSTTQNNLLDNDLNSEFYSWLEDTEVQLSHRNVNEVLLSDIYVPPHLKDIGKDFDDIIRPIDTSKLIISETSFFIFGDEQSGKTSLAKHLFLSLWRSGSTPILMDGGDIKTSTIDCSISDLAKEQYSSPGFFSNSEKSRKVLLVDNFSDIRLNKKHANAFIKNCSEMFSRIVLIALDSYQYVAREIDETDDYEYLEILPFGNIKRSEIVSKWVSLGIVEQIEDDVFYAQMDDLTLRLNSVVRKNIVPPKPIFVLSMLQIFEAYTPQNLELTSFGHCYQYLVYQALEKSGIRPSEIEMYLNVITELSWEFYKNGRQLDERLLGNFFHEYKKKYVLVGDQSIIMKKLKANSILIERQGFLSFKYPYVYYFFVAKKIAEAFSEDDGIKKEIQSLLENLHREDCANIIIFITHHTKESWILDEIQICLMGLFDDQKEATLSSESLAFMKDFLDEIPELVLEHKEIEKVRRERDEIIDDIEMEENGSNENDSVDEDSDLEPSDILAKINMVFKGIEIVGQILRNRHASISKDLLYQMVEYSTLTGLRFLQYFIEISDVSRDEVIKMLEHMLRENPTTKYEDLEREAKNTFLFLIYGVIFGVLRKISSSIGSKEADEIYDQLEQNIGTPAIKLINQAIGLQFKKDLDFKKLGDLMYDFNTNPACTRMLKEIVVQHVYMFPVDYKDRQRIESTLDIPIKGQRLISQQKKMNV